MKLTQDELGKVKGSVSVKPTPMQEFLDEYRKFAEVSNEITRETVADLVAVSESNKQEIVNALLSRPMIRSLYVNRDQENLIKSVDVEYV